MLVYALVFYKADVNFNICLYFCCMTFSIDTSKIVMRPVTVTFLEMHEPKELPVSLSGTHFGLLLNPIPVNEYRKFYYGVGEKHFWLDRMVMPDEELFDKINASNIDITVLLIVSYLESNPSNSFLAFLKFFFPYSFI